MTRSSSGRSPSKSVAERIKESARRQGCTLPRLAGRCAEVGAPWLTRDVLASITSSRRRITVDDLYAIALALNLPPSSLLVPLGEPRVALTPTITADPRHVLEWDRGDAPLTVKGHARVRPFRDGPAWDEAAAPLFLYERLAELLLAVGRADDKGPALDALAEHVAAMSRHGYDEHDVLRAYQRRYGGDQ
jgi:hypothetical protein